MTVRLGVPIPRPVRTRSDAGMTLVEMLVVLAIIGITAGASLLALGSGAGLDGRAEARRLQSRMQLAVDEAMVRGTPLALQVGAREYAFLDWESATGTWRPSESTVLREIHRLPRGMTLASADGQRIVPLDADQPSDPVVIDLTAGRQHWAVAFDGLTARLQAPVAAQ